MVGISFKVETPFDTRGFPGRAVHHTVAIDTGLALGTLVAAISTIIVVGQGVCTVRAAKPSVGWADPVFWCRHSCQDHGW